MTTDYRAMCAELVDALAEWRLGGGPPEDTADADLIERARALLAQPVAEGVLPLKERPDFIAGYREGLADRRRIIECEEAERQHPQPVAEEPTDEELLRIAATAIAPYEISGITPGEYEPETECVVEAYGSELIAYARAALAKGGAPTPQPVAEGPKPVVDYSRVTEIATEAQIRSAAQYLVKKRNCDGDLIPAIEYAIARWGHPTPQPEEADIHYAWELHDAAGDWQAGGSANSLEDVQREGNRCLHICSQDGPHKLIIQRHCVSTIEETTND